jgi:hypothetical protein
VGGGEGGVGSEDRGGGGGARGRWAGSGGAGCGEGAARVPPRRLRSASAAGCRPRPGRRMGPARNSRRRGGRAGEGGRRARAPVAARDAACPLLQGRGRGREKLGGPRARVGRAGSAGAGRPEARSGRREARAPRGALRVAGPCRPGRSAGGRERGGGDRAVLLRFRPDAPGGRLGPQSPVDRRVCPGEVPEGLLSGDGGGRRQQREVGPRGIRTLRNSHPRSPSRPPRRPGPREPGFRVPRPPSHHPG